MSELKHTETDIQNTLRDAETRLDSNTLRSLAESREQAISATRGWLDGFRGLFSAGLVTTALVVFVLVPMINSSESGRPSDIDVADENLQLLMEDPEFFLWVSNSYGSISQ